MMAAEPQTDWSCSARRLLSVAHLTALSATPDELIWAAAGAELDCIGLRLIPPRPDSPVADVVGNPGAVRALRRSLADSGIRLLDVEAVIVTAEFDPAALQPAFEVASELGCGHILSNMYITDPDAASEAFGQLCDTAAAFDLCVSLEFVPLSPLKTLDAAMQVLDLADRSNARLLVDAIHLSRSGGCPADLARVAKERLAYAHICDAVTTIPQGEDLIRETREDRRLPGEGTLWLHDFLNALPPDLPLAIEAPTLTGAQLTTRETVARAAGALRRLLEDHERTNR